MKWRMNETNMHFVVVGGWGMGGWPGTARRRRDYTRIDHSNVYLGLLGKPFPQTRVAR